MTSGERERRRARALSELRHRAVGAGFRRGRLVGVDPRELRAEVLAARAEAAAGDALELRDPGAVAPLVDWRYVAAGAAGAVGGFYAARWIVRRLRARSVSSGAREVGALESAYLRGSDVLAAA